MNPDPLSADLLADPDLPPFCDPFDEALARSGPPALFTVDAHGALRLDADRTRDGWSRVEGAPSREPALFLVRDRATGWVQLVLVTSPALLVAHPRADAVRYPAVAQARAVLRALGSLPIDRSAWPSGGDVR